MPIIHKYVKFELIGERKRKENLALEEKQKIPSKKRKLNKKIIEDWNLMIFFIVNSTIVTITIKFLKPIILANLWNFLV